MKSWNIIAEVRKLFGAKKKRATATVKTHWARTPEGRKQLAINGAKRWTKTKFDHMRTAKMRKAVSERMKAYHAAKREAADKAFREKALAQLANLTPIAPLGQNLVDAING